MLRYRTIHIRSNTCDLSVIFAVLMFARDQQSPWPAGLPAGRDLKVRTIPRSGVRREVGLLARRTAGSRALVVADGRMIEVRDSGRGFVNELDDARQLLELDLRHLVRVG